MYVKLLQKQSMTISHNILYFWKKLCVNLIKNDLQQNQMLAMTFWYNSGSVWTLFLNGVGSIFRTPSSFKEGVYLRPADEEILVNWPTVTRAIHKWRHNFKGGGGERLKWGKFMRRRCKKVVIWEGQIEISDYKLLEISIKVFNLISLHCRTWPYRRFLTSFYSSFTTKKIGARLWV